jgi:hypothetical protein
MKEFLSVYNPPTLFIYLNSNFLRVEIFDALSIRDICPDELLAIYLINKTQMIHAKAGNKI